jgi:hypothetical protein
MQVEYNVNFCNVLLSTTWQKCSGTLRHVPNCNKLCNKYWKQNNVIIINISKTGSVHDMTHTYLTTVLSFRSTYIYHYHNQQQQQEGKVIPVVFDPHVFCSLHLSLLDVILCCRLQSINMLSRQCLNYSFLINFVSTFIL